MEIIVDTYKIQKILLDSIKTYKKMSFSVAWASYNTLVSKMILQNINKLDSCTVGLHFFQTDAKFIEPFVDKGPIRFIKKQQGVFHPKMYLFWNDENEWLCLIGSANLTKSGLTVNDETMVMIDDNDKSLYKTIYNTIKNHYNKAQVLTKKDFQEYEKRIKNKSPDIDNFKDIEQFCLSRVFELSWEEYYNALQKTKFFDERLRLLKKARSLFSSSEFKGFNELARKNIAGVIKKGNTISNWNLFGRMSSPRFSNRLSDKDKHKEYISISNQLELVPLKGDINRETYEKFILHFQEHEGWGYSITTLSRLLAMRRPDQFFCITNGNEKGLLKALQVNKSIKNDKKKYMYDRYWHEVIENVKHSPWFNAKRPETHEKEKLTWDFRIAMMDALFY